MSDDVEIPETPAEPAPGSSMVAQAELARSGGIIRVMVPRDFEDADVAAVIEMTMRLLMMANEIREQQQHGGLVLPDKRIVSPRIS